jgi:hypothetical protein
VVSRLLVSLIQEVCIYMCDPLLYKRLIRQINVSLMIMSHMCALCLVLACHLQDNSTLPDQRIS